MLVAFSFVSHFGKVSAKWINVNVNLSNFIKWHSHNKMLSVDN